MNIGSKIKQIRNNKNITQQQLADAIGKSKSTIEKYEANKVENIPFSTLKDISISLECELEDLYGPDGSIKYLKSTLDNLKGTIIKEFELKNDEYYNFILSTKEVGLILGYVGISIDIIKSDEETKIKLTDSKDNYIKIFDNLDEAKNFYKDIEFSLQSTVDRLKYFDKNNK